MNSPIHSSCSKGSLNHLAEETSPYLLQHVRNPVDWYPWGSEALNLAKSLQKPIFLSIGYSACHWCHVMEHECFEDKEVALALNRDFVSIKVDREERPDIDEIYMTAVQAMTGRGGWPMSVFLTPDQKPFFAGTYFPKADRYGRPGFMTLLSRLAELWTVQPDKVILQSEHITEHLKTQLESSAAASVLPDQLLDTAIAQLRQNYDEQNGGFGSTPKFPAPMALSLYVDAINAEHDSSVALRQELAHSLRSMAQGGVYDQIGGGFHRYSTDAEWQVPHFEKMLYDNAQLATLYFEAAPWLDSEFNLRIGREICDYVLKEMTHANGAFFSTTDADSEGQEGAFFVWHLDEVDAVLGPKAGKTFSQMFNISVAHLSPQIFEGGTPPHEWFHGRIPHLEISQSEALKQHGISSETLLEWKQKLWTARQKRPQPHRDEKVLASWNGLMSSAFCAAYRMTGCTNYRDAAQRNLNFIWSEMQKDARLYATWKDGRARHFGTLEDYANVAQAHLDYYKVSGEMNALLRAQSLVDTVMQHFSAGPNRGFYYTADDAEALIVRSKNPYDSAVPAGNSVMAGVLYDCAILTGQQHYGTWADGLAGEFSQIMQRSAQSSARLLRAVAQEQRGRRELVLLGASEAQLESVLAVLKPADVLITESSKGSHHLLGRQVVDGRVTLYVCQGQTCQKAIVGDVALREFCG